MSYMGIKTYIQNSKLKYYCTVKIHRFSSPCSICGRRRRYKTGGGGRHAGRKEQIPSRLRKSPFSGKLPSTAAVAHPHPPQPDPGSNDPAAHSSADPANDSSASDRPAEPTTAGAGGSHTATAYPDSYELQTPAAQIHNTAGFHALA